MFDSLKCAKVLEEVGLPREQAEAHIRIMTELINTNLATKEDLKDLRTELKQDILSLDQKIEKLGYQLTIKLGTIVSVAIGVAVTIARLI